MTPGIIRKYGGAVFECKERNSLLLYPKRLLSAVYKIGRPIFIFCYSRAAYMNNLCLEVTVMQLCKSREMEQRFLQASSFLPFQLKIWSL